jgi:hypothetical protein
MAEVAQPLKNLKALVPVHQMEIPKDIDLLLSHMFVVEKVLLMMAMTRPRHG